MRIEFENIILRDMIESDIEDYVHWFTVEREWENWDAPWEKEDTDAETERKRWTEYYESRKNRPDDVRRYRLEIEWNGRHIGWVNAYHIDENYEKSKMGNLPIWPWVSIFVNMICGATESAQMLCVPL